MLRALRTLDVGVTATRPAWLWLGQVALVVLGVHLAADRLDDHLYVWLVGSGLPLEADAAGGIAAWSAVVAEVAVAVKVADALLLRRRQPALDRRRAWDHRSVEALVLPVFWIPNALAGSWVLGMAVEDALAPHDAALGGWMGLLASGLAAWRLGGTGLLRLIRDGEPPKRRTQGLLWAPLLLVFAGLAAVHGLPWRSLG